MVDVLSAIVAVGVVGGTAATLVVFVGAAVVVDLFDRRQARRLSLSALDDAPALAGRGIVVIGIATVAGLPVYGSQLSGVPKGARLAVAALLYAAIPVVGRGIGYAVLRRLQSSGLLASPALVVGTGPVETKIARRLREHPEYGLFLFGYLDRGPPAPSGQLAVPRLGDVTDLAKLIVKHGVRDVFVGYAEMPDDDLVDLLRACDRLDCEILVVPRLLELGVGASSTVDHLWGMPLIRLHRTAFRSHVWALKRILDIALASAMLVLVSPLMLATALALRLEVGPEVLFRQTRIGIDGQPFELLKFRTLTPQREGRPAAWSVADADRIGRVGRFLRRSSMDELPQLWNVVRGQMSLVGPRPEQSHYVRQFTRMYPGYGERHRVPAGVTGLAQVHDLRGATAIEDRVCFDNFYIEHWSLWQDIKILIRTVGSVVRMRGR
jgi:exopolysaccharide biosynthesis polyprenyl glycosylphosphotransferase